MGNQVRPRIILDPDHLRDYLSVSLDENLLFCYTNASHWYNGFNEALIVTYFKLFLFSFAYNKDIDHIFTHPYRKTQALNRFSRHLHHITWNYFRQKRIDAFDMKCLIHQRNQRADSSLVYFTPSCWKSGTQSWDPRASGILKDPLDHRGPTGSPETSFQPPIPLGLLKPLEIQRISMGPLVFLAMLYEKRIPWE